MNYELVLNDILIKMIEHEKYVPRRVGHFMKVAAFATSIAVSLGLDKHSIFVIAAVALVHDIGIKPSLEKYNSSGGKYQETEGPPIAEKILSQAGLPEEDIEKICFLVAHHHSYNDIESIDLRILIEADFLVNIYEDKMEQSAVESIYDKYIKTKPARKIFENLFLNNDWREN